MIGSRTRAVNSLSAQWHSRPPSSYHSVPLLTIVRFNTSQKKPQWVSHTHDWYVSFHDGRWYERRVSPNFLVHGFGGIGRHYCSLRDYGRSGQEEPAVRTICDWLRGRIRPDGWLSCICSAQLFLSGSANIRETAICFAEEADRLSVEQVLTFFDWPLGQGALKVYWCTHILRSRNLLFVSEVAVCICVLRELRVCQC